MAVAAFVRTKMNRRLGQSTYSRVAPFERIFSCRPVSGVALPRVLAV